MLDKIIHIAEKTGKILAENLQKSVHIDYKGTVDLVTEMDLLSEKMITDFLKENFPDHRIVAEEGTESVQESEYVWYIDPLDGTTNYAHHVPWFAISIALVKNGVPVAGVVHNPANGDMFSAEEGKGSFRNGKPMQVTQRTELLKCLLSTGFPYKIHERYDRVTGLFGRFVKECQGIRRFGAAALDLAYVAAGIYDGYWEEGLKPWDTAAGILLIKEAGGRVTDYTGNEYKIGSDTITASNGYIHDIMLQTINEKEPVRGGI
ncbi:MAG: inositol monophosphatase [Firmicutes bacterium]|nr:inositol monophosphatase [Bacillota bacterium]